MKPNTVADFWKHVIKSSLQDGCWIWNGAKTKFGYGVFTFEGRYTSTHRFSWKIHRGEIAKGLCVLHRCDNPSCVNPSHLFLGTHRQNVADRHAKGRTATGKKFARSKLRDSDVAAIRSRFQPHKTTVKQLANEYGVTESNINKILAGEIWKNTT